jgi:hypothetical protein
VEEGVRIERGGGRRGCGVREKGRKGGGRVHDEEEGGGRAEYADSDAKF